MLQHKLYRLWLAISLCSLAAFGQGSSSITGTVRDNTGAVIPGAEVVITNTAQGVNFKVPTNSDGDYLVGALGAGNYDLSVTQKGFKTYSVKDIVLRVSQKARVDVTLEVGEVSTAVTVEGTDVAQVQTQESDVAGTVTGQQMTQMVLNGRNFTQLVTLVPGVSNQTGQDEGTVGVYGSVAYSINGGRTEYNNWEIDGGDNMDNGSNGTLNVYPNVDAIAEVKVLTSNYSAAYGRNGSGMIQTVTKSGTKDFHGTAAFFIRNEAFNARNFFQSERPEYRKFDYGYTIGGPIFIPHKFNAAKEKLFFFWSQEWRKDTVPGETFDTQMPSTQQMAGNFSELCPGPDCPMDPTTGLPFPNNTVTVDPNAQAMMAMMPQPNFQVGNSYYYRAAPATQTNWREELARVDYNISNNYRTFFRYIHDSWGTVTPTPLWGNGASFPTVQTDFQGPGVSAVANFVANFTPTLLNEFVASYTTDHIVLTALGPVQRPASMTMPGIFNNGFGGKLPAVSIANGAAYGGGFGLDSGYFPWNNANPTFTFRDTVSKIWGRHNLAMGAYVVIARKNEQNSPYVQGVLTFSNSSAVTTGNAFADFLVGRVAAFSQTNQQLKYYNRFRNVEPYFQDDWRVSSRLTLNLGLRLSLFGTYREKYLQAYNFFPGLYDSKLAAQIDADGSVTGQAGALIPGTGTYFPGIAQCGTGGIPVSCMQGHLWNWAPRVGFAWDVNGNGKTAIRAAYGIFYEHTNGNESNTESLEGSPPAVQTPQQYNIVGYNNVGSGSGEALMFPLGVNSIPSQAIWPYMQQWHFDIQQELWKNMVLSVSYVGTKGTHLVWQRAINQLYPLPANQNPFGSNQPITDNDCSTGTVNGEPLAGQAGVLFGIACGGDPNPYRPYTGLGTINRLENYANSIYNALQVSARRTVGQLQFSAAYTYGHSIDDSSDRFDGNFVNSYDMSRTRGSSNFDQRQLFTASALWDVPFFKKKGLTNTLLGGWQISVLMTSQTGTPFSIVNDVYGGNAGVANGVGTGSFVDVAGDIHAAPPVTNVEGVTGPLLYDPRAYVAPRGLTFGNAGRNILNSPSRTNFNAGLFKNFALKESMFFEFRAEAFNLFNHTQWSGINNSASCYGGDNNSAGDASCIDGNVFLHPSGAHDARILQLGLKFVF
jgi:hypothetical protein